MLNKSTGNMYDWITHTWNPVKGECSHGCTYCYMKRWGKQKPIRLDESEFKTDLGTGNFIFVGSSCDLFADDVPAGWIRKTLLYCWDFDNTYLLQTKNPGRFDYFYQYFPLKTRICTTIETNRYYSAMGKSPDVRERADAMWRYNGIDRYVTIEPIMDFDLDEMVHIIRQCDPVQVNIGADSGHNNLIEPTYEKVMQLVAELEKFTVIAKKKNLNRLLNG